MSMIPSLLSPFNAPVTSRPRNHVHMYNNCDRIKNQTKWQRNLDSVIETSVQIKSFNISKYDQFSRYLSNPLKTTYRAQ